MIGINTGNLIVRDREFIIRRVFAAPRLAVFRAWTELEQLDKWWGPIGSTLMNASLNPRPGGSFIYGLRRANRFDTWWGKHLFKEVLAPEKIIFISSFLDEKGRVSRHPLHPNWPLEILNRVTFLDFGGKTGMALKAGPIHDNPEERKAFEAGMGDMMGEFDGTFDRLAEHLEQLKKSLDE